MNERQPAQLHPMSPEVPAADSPTVLRIGLGARLRDLRERCGLSREAAGEGDRRADRVGPVPDCARAVTRLGYHDPGEVERRVALRMRRQALLHAVGAPTLWAVIDESALRRLLAGPDLVRRARPA